MSAKIDPERSYSLSPSVYSRPLGTELVVLDFGRGEYFALDEVGTSIFQAIQAGYTLGEIVNRIIATYAVSRDDATRDVAELVAKLSSEGLLLP